MPPYFDQIEIVDSDIIGRHLVTTQAAMEHDVILEITNEHYNLDKAVPESVSGPMPNLPDKLRFLPKPNVFTIQINDACHLEAPPPIALTAHSCNPTCSVTYGFSEDLSKSDGVERSVFTISVPDQENSDDVPNGFYLRLVARKNFPSREIISFDYCTTEWDMSTPFPCRCGETNCRKEISGFVHVLKNDPRSAAALLPYCTPYIRNKALKEYENVLSPYLSNPTI